MASDAGVSVGLVYYHFTDRNGLLRATMEYANRMAFVAESTSEGEPPAVSGFEQLSALLFTDMAGTDTSRDNAVVWYEIVGEALFEDEIRGQVAATIQDWQQHVFGAIRQGQGDGSVRADADAVVTAQILTALVDGLLSRLAIDSLTWDAARASLRVAMERLLLPV
ncbi:hypothetical protein LEUCIP111803_02232 [Leucobacter soli]|uniref:HTH tetR-type domain-containing protein n=1 Tax=Leucobacter soli TaxID=2812850 RepID=A0A916K1W4_9MICO|nr:hypothetical protein LEUCIP111803_02232 [Leucobacter soli]